MVQGLSSSSACGILVPQPRIKPVLPALQGGFLTTLLFVKLPLICIIFSGLSCPGSFNWASHLHNTFGLDFSFPLFPIFCWCWVTELVSTLPPTFLIVKAPCAFCKILQTVQKHPQLKKKKKKKRKRLDFSSFLPTTSLPRIHPCNHLASQILFLAPVFHLFSIIFPFSSTKKNTHKHLLSAIHQVSITSDMQMIPPLRQKVKKN